MPFLHSLISLGRRSKTRQHQQRFDEGFTLVELLVVLAILSMLALIVVPYITYVLPKARTDSAYIQVQQLGSVLDLYYLDMGSYPTTDPGLKSLTVRPEKAPKWHGPYLKNSASLTDPWGRPYQYRSPGQHGEYDLFSFGPDGQEGGDNANADITNWDQAK